jgi:hypothetical protein
MGALVGRIVGSRVGTGEVADPAMGPEAHPPGTGPSPSGALVDGAVYPLDGQPPVAQGGNWGDMSWLAWTRLRGLTGMTQRRI